MFKPKKEPLYHEGDVLYYYEDCKLFSGVLFSVKWIKNTKNYCYSVRLSDGRIHEFYDNSGNDVIFSSEAEAREMLTNEEYEDIIVAIEDIKEAHYSLNQQMVDIKFKIGKFSDELQASIEEYLKDSYVDEKTYLGIKSNLYNEILKQTIKN